HAGHDRARLLEAAHDPATRGPEPAAVIAHLLDARHGREPAAARQPRIPRPRRAAAERGARLAHRGRPELVVERVVDRDVARTRGRAVRRRRRPPRRRSVRRSAAWRVTVTDTSKPLLTIRGLRVEFDTPYGMVAGVRDAGLTVHPGEVVGLVG